MNHRRSYKIKEFASNVECEVNRLKSQVDLFWHKEIRCYRMFGLKDGMRVLECGSGPGHVIEKLLKECPKCMATAIEIDSYLVDILKENMGGRCDISQQSITHLGFASESFDFVITRLVLEHLPDPEGAVREVYRVLKPGGRAVFIDNDFQMHLNTHPEIPELNDLYDAYCRSRIAEGGNPRIGRELPSILKRCGFGNVDLEILCAHNCVTGDDMFLKSEGVGIPSQLVKGGYLSASILDQLAVKWRRVLRLEHHSIFRQLFISGGRKVVTNTTEKNAREQQQEISSAGHPRPDMVEKTQVLGPAPQSCVRANRQQIFSAPPEERLPVLEGFLKVHAANALLISEDAVNGRTRVSDLGFDSLMAVEVITYVESELGVKLSLMDFFEGQTLNDIAAIMCDRLFKEDLTENSEVLLPRQSEAKVTHPLSYNQQSLWFLYQIAPESSCYNVTLSCRIVSEIQPDAMGQACWRLIKRHEILRTTYGFNKAGAGRTYQTIHSEMEPAFYLIDASGLSDDALESEVKAYHSDGFDLQNGPVLRLCLFKRSSADYIFLMTIHHIACDAGSLNIILKDFIHFYREEITGVNTDLADVQWQYRDFVRFQQEMLQVEEGSRLGAFWLEHFSGTLPVMNLPLDYDRPAIQNFTGASHRFQLADRSYAEMLDFVKNERVTLYVFLMAVFQVTLMHCCNQDDIIVGTPVAGRSRLEDKGICGHFINMVAMRGDLSGAITFREHLQRSRRVILNALDHQTYPFPLLVESLLVQRDLSRSPVFQVMFNMLNRKALGIAANFLIGASNDTPVDFGGLKIMPWPVDQEEGQFDLVLEIIDTEESLACVFKYRTDLFKEETIASIAEKFQSALHQSMGNPQMRLTDMNLTDTRAKEKTGLQKRDKIHDKDGSSPCQIPKAKDASGYPVAFMFTGQGAQYVHMAKGLYQCEPIFEKYVDYCSEMLKPLVGYDIRHFLYPVNGDGKEFTDNLNQTAITQPVLFTLEYSLARLWMSWGVQPQAMIGHSIGEYVAACLAGVFSLDDALKLVAERGRLMQMQPGGAMLAVTLSAKEIAPFLGNGLSLAVMNAPSRCVVSGPVAVMKRLEDKLRRAFQDSKKKAYCTKLRTSHAFHSEMMEPAVEPFIECVRKIRPALPGIPFISNVTGTWITEEQAIDPAYWAAHLRHTVRFSQGVDTLLDQPYRVLLEIGPGSTLSAFARQHIKHERQPVILTSIRQAGQNCSDLEFIGRTVDSLQEAGVTVHQSPKKN